MILDFDESKALAGLRSIQTETENIIKLNDQWRGNWEGVLNNMTKSPLGDWIKRIRIDWSSSHAAMQKDIQKTQTDYDALIQEIVTGSSSATKAKFNLGRAISSLIGLFKSLRVAIIGTGIGALVIAIVALINNLGSVIAVGNKVNQMFAGMKGFIEFVKVQIFELNKHFDALKRIAIGTIKGGIIVGIKEAIGYAKDLNNEMKEAIQKQIELEVRSQNLRKAQRELNVEYANAQAQIEKYRLTSRDTSKAEKERLDAAKSAHALQVSFQQQLIDNAEEELDIIRRNTDERLQGNELKDEIAAKEIEVAKLRNDLYSEEFTLVRTLNHIIEEGQEKRRAAAEAARREREELQKLIEKINEDARKIRDEATLTGLDEQGRIARQAELAAETVSAAIAELEAQAKAAGVALDLSGEKAAILAEIGEKAFRDIVASFNKLRGDLKPLERDSADLFADSLGLSEEQKKAYQGDRDAQKKIAGRLLNAIVPKPEILEQEVETRSDNLIDALQRFADKVKGVFGGDEGFEQFFSAMGSALNNVFAGISEGIQSRIDENEALIDSIRESREAVEDELDAELEAQKKGLANRVGLKEEELRELKQKEAAALKEQEELRKKAVTANLIQQGIQQTASLITAAAQIVEGWSKVPFVGVAIGVAAVAGLFAFFARAKAQAREAASATRFWKGGDLADALGPNRSSEDRYGVGEGHKIEGTNVRIGGNEYMIPEEVKRKQKPFLDKLITGAYGDMPLHEIIDTPDLAGMNGRFKRRSDLLNTYSTIQSMSAVRMSIQGAVDKQTSELINYFDNKPEHFSYTPGDMLVTKTRHSSDVVKS